VIRELTIKNFQSHTDTHLVLEPFTVLVGRSSAGKSSVTRAIKALSSNPTGKDYITHGEATMQLKARTDKGTVTLTKGKPEDSYVLLLDADPENPKRYTKLGGSVPEDITAFLGIDPKDAINYAGQFDMPYLLTTSAAEVARRLGELTNVSTIFEASRESTRRRNEASAKLKTREADLVSLQPRLERTEDIEHRVVRIAIAEQELLVALRAQERLSRLNDLLSTLQTASAALRAAHGRLAAPLPSTDRAELLLSRYTALNGLLSTLQGSSTDIRLATGALELNRAELESLEIAYEELLVEAGQCPMCGQDTTHLHEDTTVAYRDETPY
jgi:DNA repair exonuclease SbcCD ATPase subunit